MASKKTETVEKAMELWNEMTAAMNPVKHKYAFVIVYDVEEGNINGDPATGKPRSYLDTGIGWVSGVCLKRQIRNYVEATRRGEPGYEILIREGYPTERGINDSFKRTGLAGESKTAADAVKTLKKEGVPANEIALLKLCEDFWDARAFGCVATSLKKTNGKSSVTGPVQIWDGRSVEPIDIVNPSLTRLTVASEDEVEKKYSTIGDYYKIPYGVYVSKGAVNAVSAEKTGFSEKDLELLWEAILNMLTHRNTKKSGEQSVRKLIVFEHESRMGNAQLSDLYDLVRVERVNPETGPAAKFSDYRVTVDLDNLPDGVKCTVMEP